MAEKVFDMQLIRYINLFGRVTRTEAKHCFLYNNMIVFVVPFRDLDRALGRENINLRKISDILGKRIRIVAEPRDNSKESCQRFVGVIVAPIKFQNTDIRAGDLGKELIITAGGRENKAMLIGRQRAREKELLNILEQYFGIKVLKII